MNSTRDTAKRCEMIGEILFLVRKVMITKLTFLVMLSPDRDSHIILIRFLIITVVTDRDHITLKIFQKGLLYVQLQCP